MDLYNIPNWAASTTYEIDDIVFYNNTYYYCLVRHTSASSFLTDFNSSYWGGTFNYKGVTKPYFHWKISYGYNVDIKPNIKTIQFGDGYAQKMADGLNNILLPFNLSFEDRGLQEITAILHFLSSRGGYQKFYWIPPAPWNVVKIFTCPQWTPTQAFYDKYNLTCNFQEEVI